ELIETEMRLIAFYAANLAVPPRRNTKNPEVVEGGAVFANIGCAACHSPEQPQDNGQTIAPYTDLLLHDMGEGLADGIAVGSASKREWRTAPLWGIGLTEIVSGHTFFLHDGRARNLTEAILWHGGEGERSRNLFADLGPQQRQNLLAFLNSL
ncbi:MAG TPA: c-type cytochrome, partial [Devosia sp.]|nr:c-type cytochrome [Devosia sp.]